MSHKEPYGLLIVPCRMASAVIQKYKQEVCDSYMSSVTAQRSSAARVVHTVLTQGLILPADLLPSLVAMSTDTLALPTLAAASISLLKDLDKRYPGFLQVSISLLSGLYK